MKCVACGKKFANRAESWVHTEDSNKYGIDVRSQLRFPKRQAAGLVAGDSGANLFGKHSATCSNLQETGHSAFSSGEGADDRTPKKMTCVECGKVFGSRAASWEHTEADTLAHSLHLHH